MPDRSGFTQPRGNKLETHEYVVDVRVEKIAAPSAAPAFPIIWFVQWEGELFGKRIYTVWYLQGSAKEWSLGCVITASWPPLAAGALFTQLGTILQP